MTESVPIAKVYERIKYVTRRDELDTLQVGWTEDLIRKAATRLLETDGVDLTHDEAEAFVRAVLSAYDEIWHTG